MHNTIYVVKIIEIIYIDLMEELITLLESIFTEANPEKRNAAEAKLSSAGKNLVFFNRK